MNKTSIASSEISIRLGQESEASSTKSAQNESGLDGEGASAGGWDIRGAGVARRRDDRRVRGLVSDDRDASAGTRNVDKRAGGRADGAGRVKDGEGPRGGGRGGGGGTTRAGRSSRVALSDGDGLGHGLRRGDGGVLLLSSNHGKASGQSEQDVLELHFGGFVGDRSCA